MLMLYSERNSKGGESQVHGGSSRIPGTTCSSSVCFLSVSSIVGLTLISFVPYSSYSGLNTSDNGAI